jgi:hypothetical protein
VPSEEANMTRRWARSMPPRAAARADIVKRGLLAVAGGWQ